jgi:hypothetical protein
VLVGLFGLLSKPTGSELFHARRISAPPQEQSPTRALAALVLDDCGSIRPATGKAKTQR